MKILFWACFFTVIIPMSELVYSAEEDIPVIPNFPYEMPGPDDVSFSSVAISVPLGRILLIRKDSELGAIKFTKIWTGKDPQDYYVKYEAYHQGDGSGDFTKKNVEFSQKEASCLRPRGIFRLRFQLGHPEIQCGNIKLFWLPRALVYFYGWDQKEGDYGVELAPTPWTPIHEVNANDPRMRWYRYDANRKRFNIHIGKLWETVK